MTRSSANSGSAPQVITAAGPLLSKYTAIFCDVWGVAHDGHSAYATANDALKRFRDQGGVVVMVSNAPVPNTRVAEMLDRVGFWRDAWDAIVSSGDIALCHVSDKDYRRPYLIGPYDRDATFFDALPQPGVQQLKDADVIVCTGLNDDVREKPEDYRALLEAGLELELPFVCANPDLVVDVGGVFYYCAGAIAEIYEDLGGDVCWAGKPHRSAFETARWEAERVHRAPIAREKIIAIGDGLRTDIKAAQGMGINAIFITSGIHRNETMVDGEIDSGLMESLFSKDSPPAVAAMSQLKW